MNVHRSLDPDASRNGTLASMCLALVLVVASVASVNLALTGISIDLGATSSQLTWIADGYTVALAALVLPFGALGDLLGRRTILLVGTVVFGVASLMASFAQSAELLIAWRVVMGIGAAMIMPATLSTITAAFSASKRDRAVSVWAGFASSGAILGMLTCGVILEWWSWRATFLATALLAVASFVAALLLSPNSADPREAVIDVPGYVLSAFGVGTLIYGIISGAESGWTATGTLIGLAVAAVTLGAFVWWELRRRAHARRSAVRTPRAQHRNSGVDDPVPLPVRLLLRRSPVPAADARLQPAAQRRRAASHGCDRHADLARCPASRRPLRRSGQSCRPACSSSRAVSPSWPPWTPLGYWHFLVGLVFFGFGMAFTSTPSTTAIVTSFPPAKQGVGSAMNDVSRELGSALGIAMLGSLFNTGYSNSVKGATTALPPELAHAAQESPGAAFGIASRLGAPGSEVSAARTAFADALSHALWSAAQPQSSPPASFSGAHPRHAS